MINNIAVPLHIIGDPAYPLLSWVIKPFSDNGRLSTDEVNFNYRLSRARVIVENTFGRLKGRWRCLLKRNDMHVENVINVIAACLILHNMCEIHDSLPEDDSSSDTMANISTLPSGHSGNAIRDALVKYFKENPL